MCNEYKASEPASNTVTTIDLLRHGECVGGHVYRGSSDVELSEVGWQQMAQRVSLLPPAWQYIITSPLERCSKFAEALSRQYQLPLRTEPSLQEIHFGDWEGQPIDQVWLMQQEAVEQWFADPIKYPPPNGEHLNDFAFRVTKQFLSLLESCHGGSLLLITHGGVIRVLLAHCLSMSLVELNRFDIPYACLSRLQVIKTDKQSEPLYRLVAHNMTVPKQVAQ